MICFICDKPTDDEDEALCSDECKEYFESNYYTSAKVKKIKNEVIDPGSNTGTMIQRTSFELEMVPLKSCTIVYEFKGVEK